MRNASLVGDSTRLPLLVAVWLSGNVLVLINVVALRQARLVLGWVTVRGYTILVFNQAIQAYSYLPCCLLSSV